MAPEWNAQVGKRRPNKRRDYVEAGVTVALFTSAALASLVELAV
jgi:hypothetical protein